jgi:hypothetical protein
MRAANPASHRDVTPGSTSLFLDVACDATDCVTRQQHPVTRGSILSWGGGATDGLSVRELVGWELL